MTSKPFLELKFSGIDRVSQILFDYKYIDIWKEQGNVVFSTIKMTGETRIEFEDTHTVFCIRTHKAEVIEANDMPLHKEKVVIRKYLKGGGAVNCYLTSPEEIVYYAENESWTLNFKENMKKDNYQNMVYSLDSKDYGLYETLKSDSIRFEIYLDNVRHSVLNSDGIAYVAMLIAGGILLILALKFGCGFIPMFNERNS